MKLLRARQKKNNKQKQKTMQKDMDKLEQEIETIKYSVDAKKADAYA